jgi:hypothetical protein
MWGFPADRIAQMFQEASNLQLTSLGLKNLKVNDMDEIRFKISVKWHKKVDYANIILIGPI